MKCLVSRDRVLAGAQRVYERSPRQAEHLRALRGLEPAGAICHALRECGIARRARECLAFFERIEGKWLATRGFESWRAQTKALLLSQ
jgi:hypothetical protein